MSNKDLTRELKQTIKELAEEKEELLRKLSSKESRIKQILIQLENSTDDVTAVGKKYVNRKTRSRISQWNWTKPTQK